MTKMPIAKLMYHKWEEEPISGIAKGFNGTFAIFFYGCNMKCVYCQNSKISRVKFDIAKQDIIPSLSKKNKYLYTPDELSDEMINAEKLNAATISFITGALYVDLIVETIKLAKQKGLSIPIVYNSSAYETVNQIKKLDGLIDIYLPDFKYFDNELGKKYSNVPNYVDVAKKCIAEMYNQISKNINNKSKNSYKKLIIRHLVLPSNTENSIKVIKYLYDTYGDNAILSIMSQYTKVDNPNMQNFPEIKRKLTNREYKKVVDFAINLGVKNAYIQEGNVANESFIPDF